MSLAGNHGGHYQGGKELEPPRGPEKAAKMMDNHQSYEKFEKL
jgi:hypothetical protein